MKGSAASGDARGGAGTFVIFESESQEAFRICMQITAFR
jgi:hypothetical protein